MRPRVPKVFAWLAAGFLLGAGLSFSGCMGPTPPPAPNQPPKAAISASKTSALVGETIAFDGSASSDPDGTIDSHEWRFGDSGTVSGVRANHSYTRGGGYTVNLTVTDDKGARGSAEVVVAVTDAPNTPPDATLRASKTDAVVGESVRFDGSGSSDPDGSIVSFDLSFGDGASAKGPVADHAYGATGEFIAVLLVADDRGATAQASAKVRVWPPGNIPPVARIATNKTGAKVGEPVGLDGSGSYDPDGSIASHAWDLGDGSNATGPLVSKSYQSKGSYAVRLTVTDDKGATGSDSAWITVTAGPENRSAVFRAYPPHAFVGENISFDACASGDIADAKEFRWAYGDGSSEAIKAPACLARHAYAPTGQKTVSLDLEYADGEVKSYASLVWIHARLIGPNATTYVESLVGEPESLDPAYDYEPAGQTVIQSAYENLVTYDGYRADRFAPWLATELPTQANGGISPDATEYIFKLRRGVKFVSGNEVRASDAAFSLRRVVTMAHPAGPSWMLEQHTTGYIGQYVGRTVADWAGDADGWGTPPSARLIQYLGKANGSLITADDVWTLSGGAFYAIDDTILKVKLDHPYAGLVAILAYTVGAVTEEAAVKQVCGFPIRNHAQCTDVPANGLDTYTPAGTGPYMVAKGDWSAGVRLTMKANPGWWMVGQKGMIVHLDRVVMRFDPDLNTRVQLLKNGDADSIAIGYRDKAKVEGDPNVRIFWDLPTFVLNFGVMNQDIRNVTGQNIPPDFYADINVRKAFAHAFDYKGFVGNCVYGGGMQGRGPVPVGMFGYRNPAGLLPSYDLAVAKQHFQQTQWWGKGFWIEIATSTGNTARKCASDLLKASLESLNPGFHANVTSYDWPTYLSKFAKRELGLFWLGWAPDYADPDAYLTMLMRSTGLYPARSGYRNSTVDRLIDDAAAEPDAAKREALYGLVQEAAFYDQPMIWQTQSFAYQPERTWVQGWMYNPMPTSFYAWMLKGNP